MVHKMREQYDFSKGQRGKFFRKDIKINLPIYLDDEVLSFVEEIAKKKNTDISTAVNQILRSDIQLINAMK